MSPTRADSPGAPGSADLGVPRPRTAPEGDGRARLFLHAGQVFATGNPTRVTTVLGSCVAVCAWDSERLVGGINHFLLPHWVDSVTSSPRFGNVAVDLLIHELVALGARVEDLKCKLFGGAHMMAGDPARGSGLGHDNVDVARKALSELGIPVLAEDTGGNEGRKLIFQTDDGAAWVKRL